MKRKTKIIADRIFDYIRKNHPQLVPKIIEYSEGGLIVDSLIMVFFLFKNSNGRFVICGPPNNPEKYEPNKKLRYIFDVDWEKGTFTINIYDNLIKEDCS